MRIQLAANGRVSPVVTTREIMRRLNVTQLTVLSWRRGSTVRRPLPVSYSRLGKSRRIRFTERDLQAFLSDYRPDLLNIWLSG